MNDFLDSLRTQRWDDHRFYHQSRINQTLHLISACSFVVAYAYLFIDPVISALIGWLVSMTTRQSGHFFFEPLGFDHANNVTNDYKEAVKVGYNLRRKVVLLSLWIGLPVAVWFSPSFFGLLDPIVGFEAFWRRVGAMWLALGIGAVLLRTVHLFFIKDVKTGLVWMTKIITDPFHDIKIYHKAPLHLLRGQLIDPNPQAM